MSTQELLSSCYNLSFLIMRIPEKKHPNYCQNYDGRTLHSQSEHNPNLRKIVHVHVMTSGKTALNMCGSGNIQWMGFGWFSESGWKVLQDYNKLDAPGSHSKKSKEGYEQTNWPRLTDKMKLLKHHVTQEHSGPLTPKTMLSEIAIGHSAEHPSIDVTLATTVPGTVSTVQVSTSVYMHIWIVPVTRMILVSNQLYCLDQAK